MESKNIKKYSKGQMIATSIISAIVSIAIFIGAVIFSDSLNTVESSDGHYTYIHNDDGNIKRKKLNYIGSEYLTGLSQVINIDDLSVNYSDNEYLITATTNREMLGMITGKYLEKTDENKSEYIDSLISQFKKEQIKLENKLSDRVVLQMATHDMGENVFLKMNGDYVDYFFLENYYYLEQGLGF